MQLSIELNTVMHSEENHNLKQEWNFNQKSWIYFVLKENPDVLREIQHYIF